MLVGQRSSQNYRAEARLTAFGFLVPLSITMYLAGVSPGALLWTQVTDKPTAGPSAVLLSADCGARSTCWAWLLVSSPKRLPGAPRWTTPEALAAEQRV